MQHDTLMWYILDELHCYKNDHSGALGPTTQHANNSLVGDGLLTRALMVDVAALHRAMEKMSASQAAMSEDVRKVSASQATMSEDVKDMHQQFGNMSNWLIERPFAPTTLGSSLAQSSLETPQASNNFNVLGECRCASFCHTVQHLFLSPAHQPSSAGLIFQLHPMHQRIPAAESQLRQLTVQGMQCSGPPPMPPATMATPSSAPAAPSNVTTSTPLPPQTEPKTWTSRPSLSIPMGLLIPDLPITLKNGVMQSSKADSWRIIVQHWTEGDPRLGLFLPLKDWPPHYHNGPGRQFNTKYYQCRLIATEFLDV